MSLQHQFLWKHLFVISLIAISCLTPATSAASSDSDNAQAQLDSNLRKWSSKGIVDYRYTFQWICFCVPDYRKPVSISVQGGAIDAIKDADSGDSVDESKFERYRTIKRLFQFIQDAINKNAYKIEVTYDSEFGYPTSASIDYSKAIADEEKGFEVKNIVINQCE